MTSSTKLQIKLIVDKNNKRVVFAESSKDFVDILFSFLTMPIGKIIHLLGGKSYLGSMDMLYQSVKGLDEKYFNTKACKSILLKPLNSSRSHYTDLVLRVDSDNPGRYYQCNKGLCATKLFPFYSSSPNTKCDCGEIMTRSGTFVGKGWNGADGIFVKGDETYIISDDLKVMSTSLTFIQDILDKHKIKDLDDTKMVHVDLDKLSILDLLRRSLVSKSPLSGMYFQQPIAFSQSEFTSKLLSKLDLGSAENSKSLAAKIIVCKSSKDVLYAESRGEELVDLLLSFLTYPVGSIVKVLNKCSSLVCIDNLYQSAEADFVKSESTLLNPKLASFFGCNASLSLIEEMSSGSGTTTGCSICYINNIVSTTGPNECKHGVKHISISEMNPKLESPSNECGGGYAKTGVKFIISNDLEISLRTPLGIIETVQKHKFAIADLEEKEIKIGENEALNLLKACLTSKNPLSDVFGAKKKGVRGVCIKKEEF